MNRVTGQSEKDVEGSFVAEVRRKQDDSSARGESPLEELPSLPFDTALPGSRREVSGQVETEHGPLVDHPVALEDGLPPLRGKFREDSLEVSEIDSPPPGTGGVLEIPHESEHSCEGLR